MYTVDLIIINKGKFIFLSLSTRIYNSICSIHNIIILLISVQYHCTISLHNFDLSGNQRESISLSFSFYYLLNFLHRAQCSLMYPSSFLFLKLPFTLEKSYISSTNKTVHALHF